MKYFFISAGKIISPLFCVVSQMIIWETAELEISLRFPLHCALPGHLLTAELHLISQSSTLQLNLLKPMKPV